MVSPVKPPARPARIQYLLRKVWLAVQRDLDARLHAAGFDDLRSAHGAVFQAIEPEGSRVTQLAAAAQITTQGMGQLVADLERMGYVTRAPDPHDRRAKLIVLTERGWAAIAVAREALADMETAWNARLGADGAAGFAAALAELAALSDE